MRQAFWSDRSPSPLCLPPHFPLSGIFSNRCIALLILSQNLFLSGPGITQEAHVKERSCEQPNPRKSSGAAEHQEPRRRHISLPVVLVSALLSTDWLPLPDKETWSSKFSSSTSCNFHHQRFLLSSSFLVQKTEGKALIGLAWVRCPPLDQSTTARRRVCNNIEFPGQIILWRLGEEQKGLERQYYRWMSTTAPNLLGNVSQAFLVLNKIMFLKVPFS